MRWCIFGSSSNKTPQKYIDLAYSLGQEIGKRGDNAVTGGGQFGCMSGAQRGCIDAGGEVVYIVHQQFVDGGSASTGGKGVKEVICAEGDDLTERKRLLVDYGDGIIICPGGVGTWDEFWDVVSHKSLDMKGMQGKPIVILNYDGFYDGFIQQLHRGSKDGLLYLPAEKFFMVTASPKEAVQMATEYVEDARKNGVELLSFTRKGDEKDTKIPLPPKGSSSGSKAVAGKKGMTLSLASLSVGVAIGAALALLLSRRAAGAST
jgi:uncharacterized protein (TIGR00730 family)